MTEVRASEDFAKKLSRFREDLGEEVSLDEVGEIVESLLATVEGDVSTADILIHKELDHLVDFIETTRTDLASIRPADLHQEHIPTATDELDAVVGATEEAANTILEAAETLEEISETVDEETNARIMDVVTKIYEASSFQDITGQRITKVVTALSHIEDKIIMMAKAAGHELERITPEGPKYQEGANLDLLNGPQMETAANDQAAIDALFDFD